MENSNLTDSPSKIDSIDINNVTVCFSMYWYFNKSTCDHNYIVR